MDDHGSPSGTTLWSTEMMTDYLDPRALIWVLFNLYLAFAFMWLDLIVFNLYSELMDDLGLFKPDKRAVPGTARLPGSGSGLARRHGMARSAGRPG